MHEWLSITAQDQQEEKPKTNKTEEGFVLTAHLRTKKIILSYAHAVLEAWKQLFDCHASPIGDKIHYLNFILWKSWSDFICGDKTSLVLLSQSSSVTTF